MNGKRFQDMAQRWAVYAFLQVMYMGRPVKPS